MATKPKKKAAQKSAKKKVLSVQGQVVTGKQNLGKAVSKPVQGQVVI